MPYFNWTGITLQAIIVKGSHYANSQAHLEQNLFEQDIALLTVYKTEWKPAFLYPISSEKKAEFFNQLSILLNAHVHMQSALRTLASQIGKHRFSQVIEELAHSVEQGMVLSQAMLKYPEIFDHTMITLTSIGQASNFPATLQLLSTLLLDQQIYKKKIRSALSMPLITFLFFVSILLAMFTLVVPHFAQLFDTAHAELPAVTRFLFLISNFLVSIWALVLIVFLILGISLVYSLKNSEKFIKFISFLTFNTPYIKTFTYFHNYMLFYNALGTMVQAGVPLSQALALASHAPTNYGIKNICSTLNQSIQEGASFTKAVEQIPSMPASLCALVAVGEQTGNLGTLLKQAGTYCEQHLAKKLSFFALIIQPLLLIILAGCVVLLMLALYLPILSLSNTIQ